MPDVTFACPSCAQTLEAPDEIQGKSIECPTCNTQFTVAAPDPRPKTDEPETSPPPTNEAPAEDHGGVPPAPEIPEPSTAGVANHMANVARAAGAEATRGGKLVALRAQIEKIKMVDLKAAYRSLGETAFRQRVDPVRFGPAYNEIDDLATQIQEKSKGVAVDSMATLAARAKAKAMSVKALADAEVLKVRRNGRFEPLGRQVFDAGLQTHELAASIVAIRRLLDKIETLEAQSARTKADKSAREEAKRAAAAVSASVTDGSAARQASVAAQKVGHGILANRRKLGITLGAIGGVAAMGILACLVLVRVIDYFDPHARVEAEDNDAFVDQILIALNTAPDAADFKFGRPAVVKDHSLSTGETIHQRTYWAGWPQDRTQVTALYNNGLLCHVAYAKQTRQFYDSELQSIRDLYEEGHGWRTPETSSSGTIWTRSDGALWIEARANSIVHVMNRRGSDLWMQGIADTAARNVDKSIEEILISAGMGVTPENIGRVRQMLDDKMRGQ